MGVAAGGLGVGGILVAIVAYFLGFDPGALLQIQEQAAGSGGTRQEAPRGAPADEAGQFVSRVLGSTEDMWSGIFRRSGGEYRAPTLVLYEGMVHSACGMGQAAMGPFYCPGDEKLYIDLAFFRDLRERFGAPGDFAQAYVIAHEVAHHVQKLTGAFSRLEEARARGARAQSAASVRMELQADCFAGVWGAHAGAMQQLSPGDVEEALAAASAIGDDRLQKQTRGRVIPESFTHGSSAQRARWFTRGLDSGNPGDCDTFSAASL